MAARPGCAPTRGSWRPPAQPAPVEGHVGHVEVVPKEILLLEQDPVAVGRPGRIGPVRLAVRNAVSKPALPENAIHLLSGDHHGDRIAANTIN